jgi:hypothetical protein
MVDNVSEVLPLHADDGSSTNGLAAPTPPTQWLGVLAETGRIVGDIVSPASDESDWDVLSETPAGEAKPAGR